MALVAATTALVVETQGMAEPGTVTMVAGNLAATGIESFSLAEQGFALAGDAPFHSASLLIGNNFGQAAMLEGTSGAQHEQFMPQQLELADFGSGMMFGGDAGGEDNISAILGSSAFGGSHAMQMMDALLVMPQALGSAGVSELQMAGVELAGALEDVRDAAFVDALLDNLGLGHAEFAAMSEAPHGFADAMLSMEIGGDGASFHNFQMLDATDDQAALAAAAA
jgi:hypothetical protein